MNETSPSPSEAEALVADLRERERHVTNRLLNPSGNAVFFFERDAILLREAASLIESLKERADNERLGYETALASLRTEVERLQEQADMRFQEGLGLRKDSDDVLAREINALRSRLDLVMRATENLRYFLPLGWPLEEMDHNHERERDDDPECCACLTNAIGNALAALDVGTTPAGEDAGDDRSLHPAERDGAPGDDDADLTEQGGAK